MKDLTYNRASSHILVRLDTGLQLDYSVRNGMPLVRSFPHGSRSFGMRKCGLFELV